MRFDVPNKAGRTVIKDKSGLDNDGVVMGDLILCKTEENRNAGVFNGSNAWMATFGPEFCANDARSFRIKALIKTDMQGPGAIVNGISDKSSSIGLFLEKTGEASFYTYNCNNPTDSLKGVSRINDGQWHEVEGVFARGQGKMIYIDGKLEASNSVGNIRGWTDGWRIGKGTENMPTFFKGYIAEVRIDSLERPFVPAEEGAIRFEDNTPVMGIALRKCPSKWETYAARELAGYLRQISGKRLPIVLIPNSVLPKGYIAVGRLLRESGVIDGKELENIKRDGYIVRIKSGRGGVCGWRDLGSVYGVYAFLQSLGAGFYALDCESVPHTNDLRLKDCEIKAKPAFDFRFFDLPGRNVRNVKFGHTPPDDIVNPKVIGYTDRGLFHTFAYLCPYEKYGKTHPEYFALQKDGRRWDPAAHTNDYRDVQLCLSNPEVRQVVASNLTALIDLESNRTYFGVSPGDNFLYCRCEQCRAYDSPGSNMEADKTEWNMTDRHVAFVNSIAEIVGKKYPDKKLVMIAYYATGKPPVRYLPASNVVVSFSPYYPYAYCQSHDLTCEKNAKAREYLEGWQRKCPGQILIFEYPCQFAYFYEPFGSFNGMRAKIRHYARQGACGLFFNGMPEHFQDLFCFVISRMCWDPESDQDRLMNDFFEHYYGDAAPLMRQYFNDFMARIVDDHICQICIQYPRNTGLVDEKFASSAYSLFDRALQAAADDGQLQNRVLREKFCVLYQDLEERNIMNGKAPDKDKFAEKMADFTSIGRRLEIRSLGRQPAVDWIKSVSGLIVTNDPWYFDKALESFINGHPPHTVGNQLLKQDRNQ